MTWTKQEQLDKAIAFNEHLMKTIEWTKAELQNVYIKWGNDHVAFLEAQIANERTIDKLKERIKELEKQQ